MGRGTERMVAILLVKLVASQAHETPPSSGGAYALPGCPSHCGGVPIPYPFGIGYNCSRRSAFDVFQINCKSNKPMLADMHGKFKYEVIEISLLNSTVRLSYTTPAICHSRRTYRPLWGGWNMRLAPSAHVFGVLGCNVLAFFSGYGLYKGDFANSSYPSFNLNRTLGCVSTCPEENIARPKEPGDEIGDCNDGCCQASVDVSIWYYKIVGRTVDGVELKTLSDVRKCYHAFVVEKGKFNYSRANDTVLPQDNITSILLAEWSIGNHRVITCEQALIDRWMPYACVSNNSGCFDSKSWGYSCRCNDGYVGNPYLTDGCQDVDECRSNNTICPKDSICINAPGSYTCHPKTGSKNSNTGVIIGVGGSVGVFLLIAVVTLCYTRWRKQRKIREMQRHFHRNFHLLQEQLLICSYDGENISKLVNFFTLKDLKKATNNFDSSHVVGQGGHGTVYKGLIDLRVVAIKKSNMVVDNEIKGFINEIILLSHIRHRNVVKLIGCCFETEVPLLVYEFISNGTLAEHLHKHNQHAPLPWKDRLRIAAEIARSLSYLHSAADISIFHRDIKSSNILLDDKLTAKVSDFGASKFVEMDKTHVSTNIQGTFGYLDPEYMYTGQLTDKSDVYSLGVILVELLTGKKPGSILIDQEEGNMISHFILAFNENKLFDVVEASIAEDDTREEIETVARIAVDCLSFRGRERPNMKEVEAALEGARKLKNEGKIKGMVHTNQQEEAESFPYDW